MNKILSLLSLLIYISRGRRGRDRMVVGFYTTDVVSSNLDQGKVYNIR
jgi:hypothetical protein